MAEKGWGTLRYGDIAVRERIVSPAEVDEAVGIQARSPGDPPIGEILLALGVLTDRDHLRILRIQQDVHNTEKRDFRVELRRRQEDAMKKLAELPPLPPAALPYPPYAGFASDPAASN